MYCTLNYEKGYILVSCTEFQVWTIFEVKFTNLYKVFSLKTKKVHFYRQSFCTWLVWPFGDPKKPAFISGSLPSTECRVRFQPEGQSSLQCLNNWIFLSISRVVATGWIWRFSASRGASPSVCWWSPAPRTWSELPVVLAGSSYVQPADHGAQPPNYTKPG